MARRGFCVDAVSPALHLLLVLSDSCMIGYSLRHYGGFTGIFYPWGALLLEPFALQNSCDTRTWWDADIGWPWGLPMAILILLATEQTYGDCALGVVQCWVFSWEPTCHTLTPIKTLNIGPPLARQTLAHITLNITQCCFRIGTAICDVVQHESSIWSTPGVYCEKFVGPGHRQRIDSRPSSTF